MKDNTRHDRHDRGQRPGDDSGEPSIDMPTASYTPQQRRLIRKGLRVLARVAIRSHMRRTAATHKVEPDDGEEESG